MLARPPCILLPGLDGSGRLFEPLLAYDGLPFEPHVVALPADLQRDYDDLVGWLEPRLPTEPFVLLAESFSGPLATRLAARHPGRVTHLVLAATFLRAPLRRWLLPLSAMAGPALLSRPPPSIGIRMLLAGWDAPPGLVRAIRTAMAELPAGVAAARAGAALGADEAATFARITAPTLWIRAGNDRLLRAGHADEARAARPGIQIARVEGPHTILQHRPRECLDVIARLLRSES